MSIKSIPTYLKKKKIIATSIVFTASSRIVE